MSDALEKVVADRPVAAVPRLTLTVAEAAAALGVSPDFFHKHVRRELKWIYRGRKPLVTVKELGRWADESGERAR